ncbi:putative protein kinase [Aspergillus novofumigatus IBT 16806]|uniref:non-specific serine/threonine protein kinase n=1 Tax=Aspergillus novofumigatus (strain IBT 16806) TaxID=1392255 RepID=A0A2I1BUN5_ASPN1|nr:uncharacterized protein P174DRAFT_464813 [Aspergillus novofumigatus IBT 16806]PKX89107.1 hypothetical protein P174DRAFT_464813 [Aspergillus novofumigatus IBT 16806]
MDSNHLFVQIIFDKETLENARSFPSSGFEIIEADRLIEEEDFSTSSTSWLARDLRGHQYITLKVYLLFYRHIASCMVGTSHRGQGNIWRLLDLFEITGAYGRHLVLIFEAAQMSLRDMKMVFCQEGFEEDFVWGAITELLKALDFLHTHGNVIHTTPETLLYIGWSYLVDIWSVGLMAWDLMEPRKLFTACPPPPDYLAKNPERRADFWDEHGNWLGLAPIPHDRTMEALESCLENKSIFL